MDAIYAPLFARTLDWAVNFFQEQPYMLAIHAALLVMALYIVLQRRYELRRKDPERLSEEEVDQLVAEWQPQPLLTPSRKYAQHVLSSKPQIVSTMPLARIVVNEKDCVNLITTNFLGLVGHPEVQNTAIKCLQKYGCGSCGPRGFYGTIDVHLELESKLAAFMGTDAAIIFSAGYSTLSSAIPTFSSRGDLLIVDKAVNHSIKTGVLLSRSDVEWFDHNDMAQLEKILIAIRDEDIRTKRTLNRRFLVIEGLYVNTGDIAPLPKIMELKEKYCFRIIMDDGYGIGVLGKTGRGTCEHFGIKTTDVEIVAGDLGHTLASVGGFCVSTYPNVYHQRLNSSGYCFSASSPPYLVASAAAALDQIKPDRLERLAQNAKLLRAGLQRIGAFTVGGAAESPVVHLYLKKSRGSRLADEEALQQVVEAAEAKGVAVTRSKYHPDESYLQPPSLRLTVSSEHEKKDIEYAANTLVAIAESLKLAQ